MQAALMNCPSATCRTMVSTTEPSLVAAVPMMMNAVTDSASMAAAPPVTRLTTLAAKTRLLHFANRPPRPVAAAKQMLSANSWTRASLSAMTNRAAVSTAYLATTIWVVKIRRLFATQTGINAKRVREMVRAPARPA